MILVPMDRLGIPGICALGLLIFCLSFYAGSIAPGRTELAQHKLDSAQILASSASKKQPGSDLDRSTPPPPSLPAFASISSILKNLHQLANQHGMTIERANYVLRQRDGTQQLEINLPLKGDYVALRAYLHDLQTLSEPGTLDELLIRRGQSSDARIEANLRLSYYFADSP